MSEPPDADATRPDATRRAADYWDQAHGGDGGTDTFLDHALIHLYISLRAFGTAIPHMDAARREIARHTRPGARILSVGCGPATKELALAHAVPDRTFVGIDIAEATLERARENAARQGADNLELARGDFNRLELEPDSLDMVLGLGAIHHVENLEGFWQACADALRPGGCVLAQEYVGPSRFQWTDAQVEHGNRVLREMVSDEHKVHHEQVTRIDLDELIALDPSEAVRSDQQVATCRASSLEITDYWSAGCGLLQPMLSEQVHTFDIANWDHNRELYRLFAEEDRLMREGAIGDAFAMWIAVA